MRALPILLFPILELYLLVQAGDVLGAMGVVAWVLIAALLGFAVLRFQGARSFSTLREEMRSGRRPEDFLLDNILTFFAGLLLIFPGILSDAVGLLLLIPPLRPFFRKLILSRLAGRGRDGFRSGSVFVYRSGGEPGQQPHDTEDGEIIDVSAEPPRSSGNAGSSGGDDPARRDERR